jgi:hypothetical protein
VKLKQDLGPSIFVIKYEIIPASGRQLLTSKKQQGKKLKKDNV